MADARPFVFALDLGQRTGFAVGRVGDVPRSGAVLLKAKSEHRSIALGNLIAWLDIEWRATLPDLVVVEAPMPLQAFGDRGNAEATVHMALKLHGIVEAMSSRFGVRMEQGHAATIRKYFVGKGRAGNRADTKRATIDRCRLLKLIPPDCDDDDRADAIGTFEWGCATFMGKIPEALHLFGEKKRA